MTLPRRMLVGLALALSAAGVLAQGAYPNRPIKIIVPISPGSATDLLVRAVAERMQVRMGQTVVIEIRAGAGTTIGAAMVAKAEPDGYTILANSIAHTVYPQLYRSLPYDTQAAFAPVILAITLPNILVVRADMPARSLGELIALAREAPGRLNYASAGAGTFPHLAMALLLQRAGIDVAHIPFNGAAPAMAAILARQVELLASDPPGAIPQITAGTLRPLAVTSSARLAVLPDVPSAAEAGLPGFEAVGWQGFVAPAGTPEPVIRSLNAAITAALAAPDLRERLLSQGVTFAPGSPADFAAFLRQDTERWRGAVAASGASVE